jgi:hypothetical protein
VGNKLVTKQTASRFTNCNLDDGNILELKASVQKQYIAANCYNAEYQNME